jgi:hypothetical protein
MLQDFKWLSMWERKLRNILAIHTRMLKTDVFWTLPYGFYWGVGARMVNLNT